MLHFLLEYTVSKLFRLRYLMKAAELKCNLLIFVAAVVPTCIGTKFVIDMSKEADSELQQYKACSNNINW